MEAITRYKAEDGSEFINEEDCLEWEALRPKLLQLRKDLWEADEKDFIEFFEIKDHGLHEWFGLSDPPHYWKSNELLERIRLLKRVVKRLS